MLAAIVATLLGSAATLWSFSLPWTDFLVLAVGLMLGTFGLVLATLALLKCAGSTRYVALAVLAAASCAVAWLWLVDLPMTWRFELSQGELNAAADRLTVASSVTGSTSIGLYTAMGMSRPSSGVVEIGINSLADSVIPGLNDPTPWALIRVQAPEQVPTDGAQTIPLGDKWYFVRRSEAM